MMSDLDELLEHVKAYYKIIIGVLVVFVLALGWWLFRGYGGSADVGKTIDAIRTTAQNNERRAETIIDAAKHKEEEIRQETTEKITAASDDALPDLLAGLLSDYRKQH